MSHETKFEDLKFFVQCYEFDAWRSCTYANSFEEWLVAWIRAFPDYAPLELKLRVWHLVTYGPQTVHVS